MLDEKILQKMQEDMSYRGFTQATKETYLINVKNFMEYYQENIEELTEKEIMNFIKFLKEERKLQNSTINNYNSSIRFLYEVTLDKILNFKQMLLFKIRKKIPDMLDKEEMVKVKKDRYTILSKENLSILRQYYLKYKPNNLEGYLFPNKKISKTKHINRATIETAFAKLIKNKCHINKKISVHTFRHCFATHLYESGVELINIQQLLGHTSIRSTVNYLHTANMNKKLTSPLDMLYKAGEKDA